MKFYKQLLIFTIICIGIGFIMQLMNYEQASLLKVLGAFLGFVAYVFVVKDIHQMKGLLPSERFYLSILFFFANIIGLIIYVSYSNILKARSDEVLEKKESRWDNLIQPK